MSVVICLSLFLHLHVRNCVRERLTYRTNTARVKYMQWLSLNRTVVMLSIYIYIYIYIYCPYSFIYRFDIDVSNHIVSAASISIFWYKNCFQFLFLSFYFAVWDNVEVDYELVKKLIMRSIQNYETMWYAWQCAADMWYLQLNSNTNTKNSLHWSKQVCLNKNLTYCIDIDTVIFCQYRIEIKKWKRSITIKR